MSKVEISRRTLICGIATAVAASAVSSALTVRYLTGYRRPVLQGNLTIFFRSDGSDETGDGFEDNSHHAFRTIAKCVAEARKFDLNGFTLTIQHGSESGPKTFSENIKIDSFVGGGTLAICGNGAEKTKLTSLSGNTLLPHVVGGTHIVIKNLYIDAPSGSAIKAAYQALVSIDGLTFGTCKEFGIWVHDRQSLVQLLGTNIKITGRSRAWMFVQYGHVFIEADHIHLDDPTFEIAFLYMSASSAQVIGNTYSGKGTGKRFDLRDGAILNKGGVAEDVALPAGLTSGIANVASLID